MYDVAIIGCGVVGASVAYTLAKYDLNVVVIEKNNDVACGTTRANSAILHAGYDPMPNTLMAKLNVRGSVLAKEICKKLDVPYKQIGSLVLALNKEEKETIKALYERGIKNGVEGLEIIPPARVKQLEPNVADTVEGALLAKTAAVVSPWELCLALAETAVQNDCILKLDTEVQSITKLDAKGFAIKTDKGELKAKYVFNAAGNHSDDIHNMVAKPSFEILPSRGEYFLLDKCEGTRVNHVLFQCPGRLGKGVLVAPTVHGNLIVGPSSDEASKDDVANTSESLNTVRQRALRSVPSINFGQNIRNFSGVRANSTNDDFIIGEADDVNGFFDLAGIRSPGLTAAVAIGELCVDFLKNKGETLNLKENIVDTRKRISFNSLNAEEKNILIKKTPSYGRVICRCETITEGEILACLKTPIPPVSVDGVKRRVGTGMGRCQGGFCGPRVLEILAKKRKCQPKDILQDGNGSYILTGVTKEKAGE